jgi:hypothetical protein
MHSHHRPFRLSAGVFFCRLSKIAQKLCFASFVTTQPDRDHSLLGRRGRMRKPICKSTMHCHHSQHHYRSKPIIFGQWAARRFWVYRQFPNLTQMNLHGLVFIHVTHQYLYITYFQLADKSILPNHHAMSHYPLPGEKFSSSFLAFHWRNPLFSNVVVFINW